MTSHFADPKNALKRAEEHINVGDKSSALQTLHSILGTKRFMNKDKETQKTLERVMFKYLDLCIEMRRGKMAKDGLHQYKYVLKSSKAPQAQHITFLENAIKHFITSATQSLEEAQKKSEAVANEKIEDLEDEDASPESLLRGSSPEEKKSGVVPSLKFLWESYRIVLEILRNYPKLETLYADTAKQAFAFCQKYERKNEFRRLSEILRIHLIGLTKQQQNPNQQYQGVMLSNPETAQLLIEVRFAQLNTATQLELWQESFRSVEDIHNLTGLTKLTPPAEMMCVYFARLAQIFWKAKNYLFHAYSCLKYFRLLQKVKEDMSDAQKAALSSQVLLATLSVPVTSEDDTDLGFDFDAQKEKNYRMATLLSLSSPLSRGEFISSLLSKGIMDLVYPEVAQSFKLIEKKSSPLSFCASITKCLEFIRGRGELELYADSIAANAFRRLIQNISPYFQNMKLDRLFTLAKFITPEEVQKLLVESVQTGLFSVRIDHRMGVLRFSNDRLDSDGSKSRLSSFASCLTTTVANFDGCKNEQAACKKRAFTHAAGKLEEEHGSILMRMVLIEKRKEAEEEKGRRMQEEQEELVKQKREDAERLAEMRAEEQKKAQKDLAEKIKKAKRDLITKEIEEDRGQEKVQATVQKLKEQQQAMEARLKKLAKDMDHLERARREEERPLLNAREKEMLEKDKQYHLEQSTKNLEDARAVHSKRLAEKKRVVTILPFRGNFEENLNKKRVEEVKGVLAKAKENRNHMQADLEVEIEKQKELFSRREAIQEQRKKIEEAMRIKQEEEEEKKRKADEERRKADEERAEKLKAQAELQKKREQEILAKQSQGGGWRARRGEAKKEEQPETETRSPSDWRSRTSHQQQQEGGRPSGGWRERSQQREQQREQQPRGESQQQQQQQPQEQSKWKSRSREQREVGSGRGEESSGWRTVGDKKRSDWGRGGNPERTNTKRW